MDFENKRFEDIEITTEANNVSKEERSRFACLLKGYMDSIASLKKFGYDSEVIQTLVGLIYDFFYELKYEFTDYEGEYSCTDFSEEYLELLHSVKNTFLDEHGLNDYQFLINAVKCFGSKK